MQKVHGKAQKALICSEEFSEKFFVKACGCIFIENELQHRCYSVNFSIFFQKQLRESDFLKAQNKNDIGFPRYRKSQWKNGQKYWTFCIKL